MLPFIWDLLIFFGFRQTAENLIIYNGQVPYMCASKIDTFVLYILTALNYTHSYDCF
jgi:hypothetical protein